VEKENLIHFVSKKGFNIDGLGEKIVEQLMNDGIISNFADIFELKYGDLEPLERFAEKSADNLIKSIEESKKIELEKFLFALGIRYVGEETAVLISRNLELLLSHPALDAGSRKLKLDSRFRGNDIGRIKIGNLKDIINYFPKITAEAWLYIKGIGDKSAESLVGWFSDKNNIKLLERMGKLGVEIIIQDTRYKIQDTKLKGKTFVLTGELQNFTRDTAKDMIRKKGGDISSQVSKNTDYVVAGENPGSKYKKAKDLGVKIIGEEEFKKLITHE
jgi:DNA ligase (NAD+)